MRSARRCFRSLPVRRSISHSDSSTGSGPRSEPPPRQRSPARSAPGRSAPPVESGIGSSSPLHMLVALLRSSISAASARMVRAVSLAQRITSPVASGRQCRPSQHGHHYYGCIAASGRGGAPAAARCPYPYTSSRQSPQGGEGPHRHQQQERHHHQAEEQPPPPRRCRSCRCGTSRRTPACPPTQRRRYRRRRWPSAPVLLTVPLVPHQLGLPEDPVNGHPVVARVIRRPHHTAPRPPPTVTGSLPFPSPRQRAAYFGVLRTFSTTSASRGVVAGAGRDPPRGALGFGAYRACSSTSAAEQSAQAWLVFPPDAARSQ